MKKKGQFKKPKKTAKPKSPWQKLAEEMLQKEIDKAEAKHWGNKKK